MIARFFKKVFGVEAAKVASGTDAHEDVESRLAAMGLRLNIAPRAVRAERARAILARLEAEAAR